jgi:hypothetical protein
VKIPLLELVRMNIGLRKQRRKPEKQPKTARPHRRS